MSSKETSTHNIIFSSGKNVNIGKKININVKAKHMDRSKNYTGGEL